MLLNQRTPAAAIALCAALLAAAPAHARGGGGRGTGFVTGAGNRAFNVQNPYNGANYGAYGGTYGRAWGTDGYFGLNNNPVFSGQASASNNYATGRGLSTLQGFSGAGAASGTLSGFNGGFVTGAGNRAFNVQNPYDGANYGAYGGTYGRAWGTDGYFGLNNNPVFSGQASASNNYATGRGGYGGYGGYGNAGYGGYGGGYGGYGGNAGVYGAVPVNLGGGGYGHGSRCTVTQRTDSDDFGHTSTQRVRVCN